MSEDPGTPARIRIGPAGWSYPDWEGQVYPKPKPRGFDPLAYLAQYFDTIEINSTFYRMPAPKMTETWVTRVSTNPHFRFTAKLWQGFTHKGTVSAPDEAAFKQAMDPLHEAGKLGAVLLQFPYRFHQTPENWVLLRRLAEAFRDYPLVLEIRHRSWDRPQVYEFLQELGVGFCNIDQPAVSYSIGLTDVVTSPIGYLRLHGRMRRCGLRRAPIPRPAMTIAIRRKSSRKLSTPSRSSVGGRVTRISSPTTISAGRRRSMR